MDASAGWMPLDFRRMQEARKLGYPTADYFGVCAVEKSKVQSVVRVLRIPYTMANGAKETISAIQGVVTKRERSGRGLARRLLEEVHRREAAADNRFVMLWTGHSIMAHGLYNSMGYVDVYTPKLAVRRCDRQKVKQTGYEVRAFRKGDAETVEKLHAESTADRVGFTPRPRGLLPALFKLGLLRPDSLRLILLEGKPVGYVQLRKDRGWVKSDEVILTERANPEAVVSLLESEAARGWLILLGTFVRDSTGLLRRRGYSLTDYAYFGLLARALAGSHRNMQEELGTTSRSFTCHFLDYF